MAKLVAVPRDNSYCYRERQIPLVIEEGLTMVMEIPSPLKMADMPIVCVDEREVKLFRERFNLLDSDELSCALTVSKSDVFSLLSSSVQCVGCRRSAERLYNQLWKSKQQCALEPLVFLESGYLTFEKSCQSYPKFIHGLLYVYSFKVKDIVVSIPTSKRNRRCWLHSLETHKSKASGWMDVWDALSQECRDEIVLIDSDLLMTTLEGYLRKHRFCSECKSKVLKAFAILTGDIDGDNEKGYCSSLYDGLKSCPQDNHIHVLCNTDYIAHLIGRAEPELLGGRRERHARTIDIAQEEVLTCLGIHLWERLHRLWQKLRAEEQTWQILFYYCVESLRKSFEMSLEDKLGISRLEQVVEEFSEAERLKEARREQKRLKKKRRKEKWRCDNETDYDNLSLKNKSLSSSVGSNGSCSLLIVNTDSHTESSTSSSPIMNDGSTISCDCSDCEESCDEKEKTKFQANIRCSLNRGEGTGLSKRRNEKSPSTSSYECNDDCRSLESSHDNDTISCHACDDENSNQVVPNADWSHTKLLPCNSSSGTSCDCSSTQSGQQSKKNRQKQDKHKDKVRNSHVTGNNRRDGHCHYGDDEEVRFLKSMGWTCPDSNGIESSFSSLCEPSISEQEIEDFKAKKKSVENQRQELRERLRAQFQKMSVGLHAVSVVQRS